MAFLAGKPSKKSEFAITADLSSQACSEISISLKILGIEILKCVAKS